MFKEKLISPSSGITCMAVFTFLLTCGACSTDGTSTDQSPPPVNPPQDETEVKDNSLSTQPGDNLDADVVLESRIRQWADDGQQITIDYELHNNSGAQIIVLGNNHSLQTDRKLDGTVRLFKGKQETGNTAFERAPTINGQSLAPAKSLKGSGNRSLPLRIDFPVDFNSAVDSALDSLEFCIGYAFADELLPTTRDDGLYPLNQDLDLQKFSCMHLQKQSDQSEEAESALDEGQWRNTLDGVLGILNDDAIYLVRQTIGNLQLPEDGTDIVNITSFSLPDGGGGDVTRVRCDGGGHFELTSSSSAFGQVSINAQNCVLGTTTVNGKVVRSTQTNEFGNELVVQTVHDVTVQSATELVHVSTGTFENDDGHPVSTSSLHGLTYRVEKNNETRFMNDVNVVTTDLWGTAHDRSLSGSYTVKAPWTTPK